GIAHRVQLISIGIDPGHLRCHTEPPVPARYGPQPRRAIRMSSTFGTAPRASSPAKVIAYHPRPARLCASNGHGCWTVATVMTETSEDAERAHHTAIFEV